MQINILLHSIRRTLLKGPGSIKVLKGSGSIYSQPQRSLCVSLTVIDRHLVEKASLAPFMRNLVSRQPRVLLMRGMR